MPLALGAIADDFTGATDLASMLARGGMRTELVLGRPGPDTPSSDADAVVVALKSRTAPVAEAVADSVESWRWCAAAGAGRCYFKYCSTFDSTAEGNIGPVAEALMAETGATRTVYTPAFPENGRSIYMGKLFVGPVLLSESGMRNHPLTPMTDADLPRVLAPQLSAGAKAGLVPWPTVRAGATAVAEALDRLAAEGTAHVVVDALDQSDLDALAEAVRDWPLVTAGSGLGLSLGRLLGSSAASEALPDVGGPALLLSGSCSEATNGQVARWKADGGQVLELDPLGPPEQAQEVAEAAAAAAAAAAAPLLISSTAPPDRVAAAQAALGRAEAAARMEAALAGAAVAARAAGVRRFIVAGGETSGAVASALGVARLAVGPSIAPGVPWCTSLGDTPVALALNSGNFGAETFFADALETAP
ncbi:MAG: 3-oxo-tetronate kinase [Pseudomonadota bacterium]